MEDDQLKKILASVKTIAMVGVSSVNQKEKKSQIKRRPSIIVMKYLQEFGYKVIPVNPNFKGKQLHGETVFANLKDIAIPIDLVNVFRPSIETPTIAKQSVAMGAKVIWLQYGIHSEETKAITNAASITYVANKCIKQEYQRLFLKMNPVFPLLRNS